MAEALVITPRISIPLSEIEFTFVRSSGPGGQNVNKVSSKAVLRFDVMRSPSLPEEARSRCIALHASRINADGFLMLACSTSASQHHNREECLARLKALLVEAATPPKKRVKTKPSRASKKRRLDAKSRHSAKKTGRSQSWQGSDD